MKNLKDIENMSLDMLEAIADDETIKVPESLQERITSTLLAVQTIEEYKHEHLARKARSIKWSPIIGVAAAAAVAGFVVFTPNYPKDTFDDPEAAYAEIEKTFAMMSEKMGKGMELAAKVEEPVATVNSVLSKI